MDPDPVVMALAFDDRAEIWHPELGRAFNVSVQVPPFYRPQVLEAMSTVTRLTGGDVGFVEDASRPVEIRIVSRMQEFNGVPFWGGLFFPEVNAGVIHGGELVITPWPLTQWYGGGGDGPVFFPLLLHELAHAAGLGHAANRDGQTFVMGSAAWDQRDFHPREYAAWRYVRSLPSGARHPSRQLASSSSRRAFICPEGIH